LYQKDELKPSVISQLNVTRTSTSLPVKRSFLKSLKKIPLKVYSSSAGSRSSLSYHGDDPVCAICIESYKDGDELFTLSCDHCFHKECANKWFFQGCLNNVDNNAVNCPECRQLHQERGELQQQQLQDPQLLRHLDTQTVLSGIEISSASFFDIGAKLFNEGGYDFMSDFGSETSKTDHSHSMVNLEVKVEPSLITSNALEERLANLEILAGEVKECVMESTQASVAAPTEKTATTTTSSTIESTVLSTPPTVETVEETVRYVMGESTFSDCGYPLMYRKS